jgi:hypothetical protein
VPRPGPAIVTVEPLSATCQTVLTLERSLIDWGIVSVNTDQERVLLWRTLRASDKPRFRSVSKSSFADGI